MKSVAPASPCLVVEHRLDSRTHATVNAGFLLALRDSSAAGVCFAASVRHAEFVDEVLRAHGEQLGAGGIEFRALTVPRPRGDIGRVRFTLDRVRVLRQIGALVRELRPEGVLVCSTAELDPISLRYVARHGVPILTILHEVERLAGPTVTSWQVARAEESLRFAVLAPGSMPSLLERTPSLSGRLCSIPIPSLGAPGSGRAVSKPTPTGDALRFGRLGGDGRGGASAFGRLVRSVNGRAANATFVMVGSTSLVDGTLDGEVQGMSAVPLGYSEYCRRAAGIDYAVWLGDPDQYALAASASAIDAVGFARPLIALRNPFTEWLFATCGDIGFLCDTEHAIADLIAGLADGFDRAAYQRQLAALAHAQTFFSPQRVGALLRAEMGRAVPRVTASRGRTAREPA